jgi:hypothetical protein
MIKNIILIIIIIFALFCTACFSPWKGDEGIVSIRIAGDITGSRQAWLNDKIIPYLKHTITLEGPGPAQIQKDIEYGRKVNFSVIPGVWNISVIAEEVRQSANGKTVSLFAEGFDSVIIKPGSNNVKITMKQAVETKINIEPFDITFNGTQSGRVIMPLPENFNYSRFKLIFTPTGDTKSRIIIENWPDGKSSGTVSLIEGTYNLTVTACLEGSEEPDAQKNQEITVITGQKNEIKLKLDFIFKEGTGTFRWDITYSVDLNSVNMTIMPLSDNATEEQSMIFECVDYKPVQNVTSLNLNTGYYRVVIKLIGGNMQTAEFNEILHIFKGMESVLVYEFTYDIFNERGVK